jgi:hypothetical protein
LAPEALTTNLAEKTKELVQLFGRIGGAGVQYDDYPVDKENNEAVCE